MKHEKERWITGLSVVVLLLLAAPWNLVVADDDDDDDDRRGRRCSFSGLYTGVGAFPFNVTSIPLDRHEEQVFGVVESPNDADPTTGGLFPTAVDRSKARGVAFKTGRWTYRGVLVSYRYDGAGEVCGSEIQIVDIRLFDDCDAEEVTLVSLAYYFGFVNPGDADLPTPDVCVDVSGIPSFTARRMPLLEPCDAGV